MKRFAALLVGLTAACACAGAQSEAAAQDASDAVPCTVPVERGADVAWKQVSAEGFTFCVPVSWREGTGTVRGGGGTITWGPGEGRYMGTAVVRRRAGEPLPAQTSFPSVRTYNEVIGGRPAVLTVSQSDGKHRTRATWPAPNAMHMAGEAPSAKVAELQLEIYRTVRFSTP